MQFPTISTLLLTSLSFITTKQALAQEFSNTYSCPYTINKFNTFDLSPTTTVYIHTATYTSTVDCQGCTTVVVHSNIGPQRPPITATVTEDIALTETYVCSPIPTTTISGALPPRAEALSTYTPSCTTTTYTAGGRHCGPTSVVYESTVTEMSTLDCGGCSSVTALPAPILGIGPVCPGFTTTITTNVVTTTQAYTCSTTAL